MCWLLESICPSKSDGTSLSSAGAHARRGGWDCNEEHCAAALLTLQRTKFAASHVHHLARLAVCTHAPGPSPGHPLLVQVRELAGRARANKLQPHEFQVWPALLL